MLILVVLFCILAQGHYSMNDTLIEIPKIFQNFLNLFANLSRLLKTASKSYEKDILVIQNIEGFTVNGVLLF